MPEARLDNVRIYFEVSGPEDGAPIVLIPGLGSQLVAWYDGFVALLHAAGFRVIRFDNRDAGLSEKMDHAASDPPYTTEDMASDVAQLLAHVGYDSADIVGASMGGVIAQQLSLSFAHSVRSLCIIMSAPSVSNFRVDHPEASAVRGQPPARDREGAIHQWIQRERISGLDGFDEDWIQTFAAAFIDRSYCPEGEARQAAATQANPDLTPALSNVRVPTAVIHGRLDPLLSWRGGVAIADAIPDAELHVYAEMKHQLRPDLWPEYVTVIKRNATRSLAVVSGGRT